MSGATLPEVHEFPTQFREAALVPSTFNEAENTIEIVWTTGARRRAYDWWTDQAYEEELVVSAEAVDMTRFEAGVVQVIDSHRIGGGVQVILGIALRGWIKAGEGRAVIKLSQRQELAGIVQDIKAGIIRSISFGYSVERYEITRAQDRTDGVTLPLYRAVRWTPQEISFVTVPADPNASTRSHDAGQPAGAANRSQSQPMSGARCEFIRANAAPSHHGASNMPTPTIHQQAGDERGQISADISELCTRHAVPQLAAGLIRSGATLAQASTQVLEELARRDAASGGHISINPDSLDGVRSSRQGAMLEALTARLGGRAELADNEYRHAHVVDLARELLEVRGVRTTSMSAGQIIERSLHTSSDFVNLLQGAGDRVLRQQYGMVASLKRIFKASTAADFRAKQRLALGEAPALLKVGEHGEFKRGTMAETRETYSIATFGRVFGLSRQALINDDLDAFGDMLSRLGRASGEFEAGALVDLLSAAPAMSDGKALFHVDHGNLLTGAGSALQVSALSAARQAMRLQKGLDGKTPVDAQPRFLVVPAALETTGEKLLAEISPATANDVNPFSGRLELVVDPRLDSKSQTAWYLAADPAVIDTIEYSYLESAGGPEVFVREGFDVDGVEFKVRLDFGAGVLDWRGLLMAAGA